MVSPLRDSREFLCWLLPGAFNQQQHCRLGRLDDSQRVGTGLQPSFHTRSWERQECSEGAPQPARISLQISYHYTSGHYASECGSNRSIHQQLRGSRLTLATLSAKALANDANNGPAHGKYAERRLGSHDRNVSLWQQSRISAFRKTRYHHGIF